jgi:hypothetical protein
VRHKSLISSCAAILLACGAPSRADSLLPPTGDSPAWMPELERQLKDGKSCALLYLVNVREYRLAGHDVAEAKAQCEDGRSFDVSRRDDQPLFEIHLCKPVAC